MAQLPDNLDQLTDALDAAFKSAGQLSDKLEKQEKIGIAAEALATFVALASAPDDETDLQSNMRHARRCLDHAFANILDEHGLPNNALHLNRARSVSEMISRFDPSIKAARTYGTPART